MYRLKLEFFDTEELFLSDITNLLYDLELSYDLSILASLEKYSNYNFSYFFWRRNGRPLNAEDRLKVVKIKKESPLSFEITIPSITGIWIFIQILKTLIDLPLDRRKRKLEIEKLEHEVKKLLREEKVAERDPRQMAFIQRAQDNLSRRLAENPLALKDMEIVNELAREDKKNNEKFEKGS